MCSSLKPVKIPTARCTECRYLCRVKALLQSVHNPAFTSSHALHVNPSTQDALLQATPNPAALPPFLLAVRCRPGAASSSPPSGEEGFRPEAACFGRLLLSPDYGRDIHARAHRVMAKNKQHAKAHKTGHKAKPQRQGNHGTPQGTIPT